MTAYRYHKLNSLSLSLVEASYKRVDQGIVSGIPLCRGLDLAEFASCREEFPMQESVTGTPWPQCGL